jgi:Tfp pilus assembly PilM family ATPase
MHSLILGISITGQSIHAVEVAKQGLTSTIRAIEEWTNPLAPGFQEPDAQALELLTEYLAAFLKINQIKATHASIALDTDALFIHRLPIEGQTSENTIKDQIRWELEQYYPGAPAGEFVTAHHRMSRFPSVRLNEVLSVSVRRRTAQALERMLATLGLRLHILDADHFSAESALRMNYPDSLRRHIALLGVKPRRLDISTLKNGNLESYSYTLLESTGQLVEEIGRLSRLHAGVFTIVVYGPGLTAELLHDIRRGSSTLVEALNPLRQVAVAESLRVAEHLSTPSYQFAAAIGVALRRD